MRVPGSYNKYYNVRLMGTRRKLLGGGGQNKIKRKNIINKNVEEL